MEVHSTPPSNARRIWRIADLPPERAVAEYIVRNGADESRVTFSKRKCQVIELLRQAPVYCASPVRISDIVFLLKTEDGIEIETLRFPGDPTRGIGPFGVYVLRSDIRPAVEAEVAA